MDVEVLQLRWLGMTARNFWDAGYSLMQCLYFGTLVQGDDDAESRTTRPPRVGGARAGRGCRAGSPGFML
ncbi:hypothetical protein VMCG_10109 [Cytospora schulzeri]|uniref:Uncharacterized protein n=1 Tax=Cytospora schulzeri TaxID=448051 RepID=A0A423VGC4_9PEZI|nr:hypothetical protein VMCG_10109 [Valsa malicola]